MSDDLGFLDSDHDGTGPAASDLAAFAGLPFAQAVELLTTQTEGWSSDRKAAMLAYLRAQNSRITLARKYEHPAQLAADLDPSFVITPALEVISRSVERAIRQPRRNLVVTMPPQEGKSNLCAVWAPLRALQLNPDRRIILATYADALAEDHSRTARAVIAQNGTGAVDPLTGAPLADRLGLALSEERSSVSGWRIRGSKGGMIAVGLGSSITGRPADLLIIDDPVKNMQEADSKAHRKRVLEWFRAVAMTRLAPDASVILIQTRWHKDDLAGQVLAAEEEADPEDRSWRHINIPAIAAEGIKDALGREPGTAMVSARGRTQKQFEDIRRAVGERVWYALYQGVPSPPDGNVFTRSWFEDHRLTHDQVSPMMSVVGIDPADTGEDDETGIIAGSLLSDSSMALTHDRSGLMTSDQWSRAAVLLAIETGAREIAIESYTTATTYERVVKEAWKALHREAVEAYKSGGADSLTEVERRLLPETMPFTIFKWRGVGDAVARSAGMSQAFETGRLRTVGAGLSTFEEMAVTWQTDQHQPDRVAAGVIVHDRLAHYSGQTSMFTSPNQVGNQPRNTSWLQRKLTG